MKEGRHFESQAFVIEHQLLTDSLSIRGYFHSHSRSTSSLHISWTMVASSRTFVYEPMKLLTPCE